MDLKYLSEVAIKAALEASQLIQKYLDEDIKIETKIAGNNYASQVVTEVDRKCEAIILSHLMPTCNEHNLAILSEETEDDQSRFEKKFFWCIDPLDGTLAFINKQTGFSISIALIANDGTTHIGIVLDPSTNNLYHAIKGQGVYKNNKLWKGESSNKYLSYLTDKKLKDDPKNELLKIIINKKIEQLGLNEFKEKSGAGAVMNAIYVIENGPAIMIKPPKEELGGGSIWDYAATSCIFHELGLRATDFHGNTLPLNKKDGSFMNDCGVWFENT